MCFLTNDPLGQPECRRRGAWVRLHRHRPVLMAHTNEFGANWPGEARDARQNYEGTLAQIHKDWGSDRPSQIGYVEVITHDGRKLWWRTMDCEFVVDPGHPGKFFGFQATYSHQLHQMMIPALKDLHEALVGGGVRPTEANRGKMIVEIMKSLGVDVSEGVEHNPCFGKQYEAGDVECMGCQYRHVCSNVVNGVCVPDVSTSMTEYAEVLSGHMTKRLSLVARPGVDVRQEIPHHDGMAVAAQPKTNMEACRPPKKLSGSVLGSIGAGPSMVTSDGLKQIGSASWQCRHGHVFEVPRPGRGVHAARHANTCPECKPHLKPLHDFKAAVRNLDGDEVVALFRKLNGGRKAVPKGNDRIKDSIIRMGKKKWGEVGNYPVDLLAYIGHRVCHCGGLEKHHTQFDNHQFQEMPQEPRATPQFILDEICPRDDEDAFMHDQSCGACGLEAKCGFGRLRPKMPDQAIRDEVCREFGNPEYDHSSDDDCRTHCGVRNFCNDACKGETPNLFDIDYEKVAATKARGFPCWDGVPEPLPGVIDEEFPPPSDCEAADSLGMIENSKVQHEQDEERRHYERWHGDRLLEVAEARLERAQRRLDKIRREREAKENPINQDDLGDWLSRPIGVPNGVPRKHKTTL